MTLYLLPNLLYKEADHREQLPSSVDRAVAEITGLIAEDAKEARAYLKRFGRRDLPIPLLNEHTPEKEIDALLEPLKKGETWGLISDAGLPCLADPGALLVRRAKESHIQVKAFPGPCSLLLALMLSGLEAQRFAFHGYLPREEDPRKHALKELEKRAKKEEATQLFIEAPYRNMAMLESALAILDSNTWLAVAVDLTAPTECVYSMPIHKWKTQDLPDINKRPAVFLIRVNF